MTDTSGQPSAEAPKSATDAEAQAQVEHAQAVADQAKADAEAAQARADAAAEVVAAAEAAPAAEPSEVQKAEIAARASVVVTETVKHPQPMVTTEEARLAGIKASVGEHLRTGEPDL